MGLRKYASSWQLSRMRVCPWKCDSTWRMAKRFVKHYGRVCMTIMLSVMICCSELCKDLFAAQMVYEIQEVKGMDLNDSGKLLNSERAISQVKYVHDIGH